MIHQGWLYLSPQQYQGVHKDWRAIQAWLDARGMFIEMGWGHTPKVPHEGLKSHPRLVLGAVDAAEDFDRDAAFIEFRLRWL